MIQRKQRTLRPISPVSSHPAFDTWCTRYFPPVQKLVSQLWVGECCGLKRRCSPWAHWFEHLIPAGGASFVKSAESLEEVEPYQRKCTTGEGLVVLQPAPRLVHTVCWVWMQCDHLSSCSLRHGFLTKVGYIPRNCKFLHIASCWRICLNNKERNKDKRTLAILESNWSYPSYVEVTSGWDLRCPELTFHGAS